MDAEANEAVGSRGRYHCQLLEDGRQSTSGSSCSSLDERADCPAVPGPPAGGASRSGGVQRSAGGAGAHMPPPRPPAPRREAVKTGQNLCQSDGKNISSPGHFPAAGKPSPWEGGEDSGVEGGALPDHQAPSVGPALPHKTAEWRDQITSIAMSCLDIWG